MHTLNIVGMDPSLSNWGMVSGTYCIEAGTLALSTVQLARTQKSAIKRLRVNTSDLERAHTLSESVFPIARDAHVIFVEVPHGSQSARAMASYGICIGILACMQQQGYPFIQVSAEQVKLATVGNKKASKQQIIDRAINRYPELAWPTKTLKGKTSYVLGQCEHLADAIGAVEAGLLTAEFTQLIRTFKHASTT